MIKPFKSGLCDTKAHTLNHYRGRDRTTGTLIFCPISHKSIFTKPSKIEFMSTVSQTLPLRSYWELSEKPKP